MLLSIAVFACQPFVGAAVQHWYAPRFFAAVDKSSSSPQAWCRTASPASTNQHCAFSLNNPGTHRKPVRSPVLSRYCYCCTSMCLDVCNIRRTTTHTPRPLPLSSPNEDKHIIILAGTLLMLQRGANANTGTPAGTQQPLVQPQNQPQPSALPSPPQVQNSPRPQFPPARTVSSGIPSPRQAPAGKG